MLKSKEMFNTMKRILSAIWSKKKDCRAFEAYLESEFAYPASEYMEYVIGARELNELNPKEIFWLIKGINKLQQRIKIEDYFVESEIREFSNAKFVFVKESIYPYVIDIKDEISDDQWVTTMDMDLMKDLYDKQLIVYNPNTQRELKRIVRGQEEIYTVNVNMSSVDEIRQLMYAGKFIPNDLSFNLNLDNPDVKFDIVNEKLVLYEGRLDIIDGFHRFKAAIMNKADNPDFNFKFIINLMNFNEAKACDYIAQEDKRNKISIDYRKSLDTNNLTNIIIDRINASPDSLVRGLIGKEGTNVISRADLFWLVDTLYNTKDMSRGELLRTAGHIINVMNLAIDDNADYLNGINFMEMTFIIYATTVSSDDFTCFERMKKAMNKKDGVAHLSTRINKKKILTLVKELFE